MSSGTADWLARLNRSCRLRPLLVALLAVVPVTGLVVAVGPTPYFESNDDVLMMLNLSGRVTSVSPAPDVVFMNIFLARALVGLYQMAPDVAWYGWMFVAAAVVAQATILYSVLLLGGRASRLALFGLCGLLAGLPSVVTMQFTRVAFLVGLSGVFLLYAVFARLARSEAERWKAWPRMVGACMLLMWSFLIRDHVFLLLIAVSAPVLLYAGWQARRRGALRHLPAVLALAALLALLGFGHERAYDADPDWSRFQELSQEYSWFVDYGVVRYDEDTARHFAQAGWSENDFLMMTSWFFVDPETYSPEKLRQITAGFQLTRGRPLARLLAAASMLIPWSVRDPVVWISLLLAGGIALAAGGGREARTALLATALAALLAMIGLLAFLKLPPHLYGPLVTALPWFALLLTAQPVSSEGVGQAPRRLGLLLLAVAALSMAVQPKAPIQRAIVGSREAVAANYNLRLALLRLRPDDSQTYVSWATGFRFEAILPLERKEYLQGFRVLPVGGWNQSPLQQRMMDAQGIQGLPRDLFERDDVFLIGRGRGLGEPAATRLRRYVAEHYGVEIEVVSRFQQGDLGILQVVRATGSGRAGD